MSSSSSEQQVVPQQVVQAITTKPQLQALIAAAGDRCVIVDFSAVWCKPCKIIAPVFDRLCSDYVDTCCCASVNVDRADELVEHFRIRAMPTFVVMHKNEVVNTVQGADINALTNIFVTCKRLVNARRRKAAAIEIEQKEEEG